MVIAERCDRDQQLELCSSEKAATASAVIRRGLFFPRGTHLVACLRHLNDARVGLRGHNLLMAPKLGVLNLHTISGRVLRG